MGRPRTAKRPKPEGIAPEDESQDVPDEEPVNRPEEPEPTPTISKADAVRAALSAGKESPGDIHDFVLAKFGHDIPNQTISSYKAQEKARQAKRGDTAPRSRPGRKPRTDASPAVEASVAPPPKQTANGDIIGDIEDIRRLIDTHGKDGLKRLVDVL